jgi:hypothetical protein
VFRPVVAGPSRESGVLARSDGGGRVAVLWTGTRSPVILSVFRGIRNDCLCPACARRMGAFLCARRGAAP